MKCLILFVALCCFGLSAGQGITTDFLEQNLLNPMLQQIQNNALGFLSQTLTSLFASLFSPTNIGKRDLSSLANFNLNQVLAPFIAKVKEIYHKLFQVFVQIVNNAQNWIQKPDWARIELVRAGDAAELEASLLNIDVDFLKPLLNIVQTHLHALVPDLQAIVHQVLSALQHPVQSLIGSGSLLQP